MASSPARWPAPREQVDAGGDTVHEEDVEGVRGRARPGEISTAARRRLQALAPGHEREAAGIALLDLLSQREDAGA